MLPTLSGRLQTRVFAVLVFGGLWTLLITPLLPGLTVGRDAYGVTFRVLLALTVLGIAWELIYHVAQQFRWEKDWPTLFGLFTAVNEGLTLWVVLSAGLVPGIDGVAGSMFAIHFCSTWLVVWLMTNGPMRVPFVRWRFRGGRLV
jgi:hypothetical protein